MRDFRPQYCELLIKQVEEEIAYLRSHGHTTRYPVKPCIFCQEYKNQNICNRIDELTKFLSELMVKLNMKPSLESLPNKNSMPVIGLSD